MPEILRNTPAGNLFGFLWFFLLFLAAFTSSVAIAQPVLAFLQNVCGYPRKKAAIILGVIWAICTLPCIFWNKYGYIDELDSWAGELLLVLFALIELIFFIFFLGINKGWEELHIGAAIKVPSLFKYILLIISPLYLLILLGIWSKETLPTKFHIEPKIKIIANYKDIKIALTDEGINKFKKIVNENKKDIVCKYKTVSTVNNPLQIELVENESNKKLCPQLNAKDFKESIPQEKIFTIEALYCAPYIWLGRLFVFLSIIIFAYLSLKKVKEVQE